jgi:hypothetical protein
MLAGATRDCSGDLGKDEPGQGEGAAIRDPGSPPRAANAMVDILDRSALIQTLASTIALACSLSSRTPTALILLLRCSGKL